MMIEIHGAWVHNKGAHLMLQTAAEKLRAASPDVDCCMEAHPDPYVDRAACRMFQIFPRTLPPRAGPRHRVKYGVKRLLGTLLGANQRRTYGLTFRKDIDALVDVSGYRLGDAWPIRNLEWMAHLTSQYRSAGKPVVLLPQMFGPFTKPGSAELFRLVLANADLAYAREPISLQHVRSVGGRQDHVRMAPEVTIFADPRDLDDPPAAERRYAGIVPNMRIMDKHGSEWGDVYLDRLASAGRRLLEAGLNVCVIVHDQLGEDGKLAGELLARLADDRVRLCCEGDPLRMKKFISEARLLVGSRYHALVAALSTGVPVVALGWGHKYDMLLEDFGVPECLHPAASGQAHLAGLLDRLLDDAEWAGMHETIRAARRRMGGVNAEMWATVLSVLGLTRQADAP